jgi:hypothetical protein
MSSTGLNLHNFHKKRNAEGCVALFRGVKPFDVEPSGIDILTSVGIEIWSKLRDLDRLSGLKEALRFFEICDFYQVRQGRT